jgi:hypothetical protein
MAFKLLFTRNALDDLNELSNNPSLLKRLKSVRKALAYLEMNPRHQSLNTHKYVSIKGHHGEDIFEAYAENSTPSAYRIFWHYGPGKDRLTIIAIVPHP